jgi:hypothetical protein
MSSPMWTLFGSGPTVSQKKRRFCGISKARYVFLCVDFGGTVSSVTQQVYERMFGKESKVSKQRSARTVDLVRTSSARHITTSTKYQDGECNFRKSDCSQKYQCSKTLSRKYVTGRGISVGNTSTVRNTSTAKAISVRAATVRNISTVRM